MQIYFIVLASVLRGPATFCAPIIAAGKIALLRAARAEKRGGTPGGRPFPFPRVLGDKTADSFRSRGNRGRAAAPNTSTSIAARARPTEKLLLRHRLFTLEVDYTHDHEMFFHFSAENAKRDSFS